MIGHYDRVNALKIPQYHQLMWPALQATKELGGSATVREMNERTVASAGITEEQQAVPHGEDGRMSEVEYGLHWARTHLKGIGALENSARGECGKRRSPLARRSGCTQGHRAGRIAGSHGCRSRKATR